MSESEKAGWHDVYDSELPPVGTELILLVRWADGERISQGEVRSSETGRYIEDWGADKGGPVKFKLASDLLAEATAGEIGINGLTEAETMATASVFGLK